MIAMALSNAPGRSALVYVEDFCRLISEHGASAWFVNRRTTRKPSVLLKSRADGRQHLVSRLVARDPAGHLVETRDSDFANLRRGNISTRVGGQGGSVGPPVRPLPSPQAAISADPCPSHLPSSSPLSDSPTAPNRIAPVARGRTVSSGSSTG